MLILNTILGLLGILAWIAVISTIIAFVKSIRAAGGISGILIELLSTAVARGIQKAVTEINQK